VRAVGQPVLAALGLRGDKYLLLQRLAPEGVEGEENAFVLGTTHLKAGLSARFEERRAKEAHVLLEVLGRFLRREDEAVVLAGDLNAHPSPIAQDAEGERLMPLALPVLMEHGGFRCAYTQVAGAPPTYTYWAGWTNRDVKTTFDHVLLRGGLMATAALAMPDAALLSTSACRLPNSQYPSDHLSLVVELGWGGGQASGQASGQAAGLDGHVQDGAHLAMQASATAGGAREIIIDTPETFSSLVTEQTTGGKVWDAAVALFEYLEARPHLLSGQPSVLECGAGTGWLGMSLAARHELSDVVLTEMVQGGALRWLDYNVQRNRDAGVPLKAVRTVALDWAWMSESAEAGRPAACAELLSTSWDLVLGSDLVYNDAGVTMLPRVFAALAKPRATILYAHTFNRFEFLDRDFLKALRAQGLRYREVWPITNEGAAPGHGNPAVASGEGGTNAANVDQDADEGSECSFSGELFPEFRLAVLLIERECDHRAELS